MRVLLVHAHPEPRSFSAALKKTAIETLAGAGHEVVVSDLYAMGFDPVAKAEDFGTRADPDYLVYALEQRAADRAGTLSPDIAAEVGKLDRAELLILNFPLFWFSVPAILKGWIDRTFLSGRAYGGRRFYEAGGLAGRKALCTITLGGRESMFGPEAIHGEFQDMLRPILRGTLWYCGMEVLPPFVAWHVPYVTEEVRAGYLKDYRATLGRLDDLTPLSFPRTEDFDREMRPRRSRS